LDTAPLQKGGESEIAPLQKGGGFESFSLKKRGVFEGPTFLKEGMLESSSFEKGETFESPPLLKGDLGGFFKPPLNSTALPVGDSRNRKPAHYSKTLMLKHESETLGFVLSVHPLDLYRNKLEGFDYIRAQDLHSWVGKQVTTIGWQITSKTVRTKDGQTMKFISF